jgi:hypothetical protein
MAPRKPMITLKIFFEFIDSRDRLDLNRTPYNHSDS